MDIQSKLSSSNTDGSFTIADLNLFLFFLLFCFFFFVFFFMTALIPYIIFFKLSWIIKCLFMRKKEPLIIL